MIWQMDSENQGKTRVWQLQIDLQNADGIWLIMIYINKNNLSIFLSIFQGYHIWMIYAFAWDDKSARTVGAEGVV